MTDGVETTDAAGQGRAVGPGLPVPAGEPAAALSELGRAAFDNAKAYARQAHAPETLRAYAP